MVNTMRMLERPGCTLRFADSRGSGSPVVFLHGAGMDHVMFAAQHAAVAEAGFRAISWDMRGHGESRPSLLSFTSELALDDLSALLDHLDVARHGAGRPVLVGHSLGGNLAQEAVRRHPHRYAGLSVLDSTWNAGPLNPLERVLLKLSAPILRIFPERSLARIMAHASAETREGRDEAERAFGQLSKHEFLQVWDAVTGLVRPDPDARTPVPLQLIRGGRDHTGNIADAMPEWATVEGVEDEVVSEAGHIVTLDAPDAVSELIVRFLTRTGH